MHRAPRLRARVLAAVVLVVGFAGCAAGPHVELTTEPAAHVQTVDVSPSRPDLGTVIAVAVFRDWLAASDAWYAWAAAHPPQIVPRPSRQHVGGSPGSLGAKACVAQVENGGSYARGSNPSHTGRYQFSYSLWVANGGNPDTWENASPEEQDQVFDRAWSSPGGPGNWLPYDPC